MLLPSFLVEAWVACASGLSVILDGLNLWVVMRWVVMRWVVMRWIDDGGL
jgi:hypothetical protein